MTGGRRRVFVRGVGAWTPLGRTWPESAAALAAGKTAVAPVRTFDVRGFPSRVAAAIATTEQARVNDHGHADVGAHAQVNEDRRLVLARAAAREAWTAAALTADPARIGVFIGAESGRASFATVRALAEAAGGGATFDHQAFGLRARPFAARLGARVLSPSAVAAALAAELGAGGPVETISVACASGSAAVVEATRALRGGECDLALAGGVGADVDPLMLAGFGLLGALSAAGRSCPFDVRRDGFVVGEGAAMAVLAVERGAAAVEIAGAARSLDGHHLTAPDPTGDGAARAMRAALADAGAGAGADASAGADSFLAIDVVQAHGTSTPLNDAVEAAALRRVLGGALDRAHVSSVKGALGHAVAGAGAIGFLAAVHAVAAGEVFPTAGLEHPDPACDLPHVMARALRRPVETALANAFAFGGANACLVLRRCPEAA